MQQVMSFPVPCLDQFRFASQQQLHIEEEVVFYRVNQLSLLLRLRLLHLRTQQPLLHCIDFGPCQYRLKNSFLTPLHLYLRDQLFLQSRPLFALAGTVKFLKKFVGSIRSYQIGILGFEGVESVLYLFSQLMFLFNMEDRLYVFDGLEDGRLLDCFLLVAEDLEDVGAGQLVSRYGAQAHNLWVYALIRIDQPLLHLFPTDLLDRLLDEGAQSLLGLVQIILEIESWIMGMMGFEQFVLQCLSLKELGSFDEVKTVVKLVDLLLLRTWLWVGGVGRQGVGVFFGCFFESNFVVGDVIGEGEGTKADTVVGLSLPVLAPFVL